MAGGMGGMGGGLMGSLMRSAMGGMKGAGASNQAEPAQSTSDVYDVDRWKRADDLDNAPTMVQAVRNDWEKKAAEKRSSSLKQKAGKLLKRFSRKTPAGTETPETQTPQPAGGTVVTPEMKRAAHRINVSAGQEPETAAMERRLCRSEGQENYLGLHFETGLDGFFTANPVNSAILAVDQLGLGPLTLNQVTTAAGGAPAAAFEAATAAGKSGNEQENAAQQTETNYMDALHKSRQQRKYDVRIT